MNRILPKLLKLKNYSLPLKGIFTIDDDKIQDQCERITDGDIQYAYIGYISVDASTVRTIKKGDARKNKELYFPIVIARYFGEYPAVRDLVFDDNGNIVNKELDMRKYKFLRCFILNGIFTLPKVKAHQVREFKDECMTVRFKRYSYGFEYVPLVTEGLQEKIALEDRLNQKETIILMDFLRRSGTWF